MGRWAIYRSISEQYGLQDGWSDEELFGLPETPNSLYAGIYWLVSGIQGWTELAFDPETAVVDGVLRFERAGLRGS